MVRKDIEDLEIGLLISGIRQRYGYDFGHYARASLERQVTHRMAASGARTVSELLARLMHEETLFEEFLSDMSITVTEMFRDPPFFRAVREHVIPMLKTLPAAKIWHAGCATGQEVYSMAILLREEGCLERCRIYATDYNNRSLAVAAHGVFPMQNLRHYAANYYAAGGEAEFSDYYRARYGWAKMSDDLKEPLVFANHNLLDDPPFADIDLIVCRNVLMYFDRSLQDRVVGHFLAAMGDNGFLCLGQAESTKYGRHANRFEVAASSQMILRRADHRGLNRRAAGSGCDSQLESP